MMGSTREDAMRDFIDENAPTIKSFSTAELVAELKTRDGIELLMPQISPLERAVLITRSELRERIKEELKELADGMPPEGIIENLVDMLARHLGNDLGQWEADNLKSFFNRDDVLKIVGV